MTETLPSCPGCGNTSPLVPILDAVGRVLCALHPGGGPLAPNPLACAECGGAPAIPSCPEDREHPVLRCMAHHWLAELCVALHELDAYQRPGPEEYADVVGALEMFLTFAPQVDARARAIACLGASLHEPARSLVRRIPSLEA